MYYRNLPVNATVKLLHPWSGDSQGQETFLALSANKQTCNYDRVLKPLSLPINTKVNHYPSLSTLRSKGFSRSKMKW